MALVKCSECGREVSSKAAACPHCGAKRKSFGCGCLAVLALVFLAIVMFNAVNGGCDSPNRRTSSGGQGSTRPSLDGRYPGPWREDVNADIIAALAAKQIQGCGQFKWRASALNRHEYLVYCTGDGENWKAYLVWTLSKDVQGPFTPDLSLSP